MPPTRCRPSLALTLLAAACACSRAAPADVAPDGAAGTPGRGAPTLSHESNPPSSTRALPPRAAPSCPGAPERPEVAPGVLVERRAAPLDPPVDTGDRCITVVRIDPARHRLRLLTALPGGASLPAPAWATRHGLMAVINASMYQEDLHSTGLLIRDGAIHTGRDNPSFGGFMAFDPVDPSLPPIAFFGRQCPGFDLVSIRRQYRSIVQNYRLLDCDARPIAWRDEKAYSAAAIGMDRRGRLVLLHARTPSTMTVFARAIAAPELELAAAHYVEGGPEASLYMTVGGSMLEEVGSYETRFNERDDNRRFWDIPNILGVAPR